MTYSGTMMKDLTTRTEQVALRYELTGLVRAFVESRSMRTLADAEPDFEWWFRLLAKKVAEITAAETEN